MTNSLLEIARRPAEVLSSFESRARYWSPYPADMETQPCPMVVTLGELRALAMASRIAAPMSDAVAALEQLVAVLKAAGLRNLSNGVQLGQIAWLVKATDAMEAADEALAALRAIVGAKP